ncbi:hypothetical protein ACMDB5_02015 [Flavobacterium sp. W1B]|uniref:hypothetical protein n=1 Tax=Flavobacterium sp. W1B TaxID=3394146 RepID=UPI0039BCE9E6
MKLRFLFVLLFVASYGFSQSVNDYKAVVLPLKFDFMKSDNQYRLATLSKFNLNKAGFEAFYNNEVIPNEYNDRCGLLYYDVVKDNGFLVTKLFVTLKDCYGKIIFQSEVGKSKEKDYQVSYTEALNDAFKSVYALQYKYNGQAINKVDQESVKAVSVPVAPSNAITQNLTSANLLYAQPMNNGFQLVDSTPKVVMKVFKTSSPNCLIAVKGENQGVLILKDNRWFFEYYQNDKLISEKVEVKF